MDPKFNDRCIIRREDTERHTHREDHTKIQAATGGVQPQAKGCTELPDTAKGRKDSPLEPLMAVALLTP